MATINAKKLSPEKLDQLKAFLVKPKGNITKASLLLQSEPEHIDFDQSFLNILNSKKIRKRTILKPIRKKKSCKMIIFGENKTTKSNESRTEKRKLHGADERTVKRRRMI